MINPVVEDMERAQRSREKVVTSTAENVDA
jgi:hypothetical protein